MTSDKHLIFPIPLQKKAIAWCLSSLPDEGCGLLLGFADKNVVMDTYLAQNAAKSAKLYSIEGRDYLRADRKAEESGYEIIGVFHSHTHTDPYPSPTDVELAPDPNWHYVLVSLRHEVPMMRSYRIIDSQITEEPIFAEGVK